MSRFELYGNTECYKCEYFVAGKDDLTHTPRCLYKENLRSNWLGPVYIRRPDTINWNHKCKWFQEK